MPPTLADEIKRLRGLAGMTQKQLADAVGVAQGSIAQLETGKIVGFSVTTLFKLAKALGVDCSHFAPWFAGEATPAAAPEPAPPPEPPRPAGKRK